MADNFGETILGQQYFAYMFCQRCDGDSADHNLRCDGDSADHDLRWSHVVVLSGQWLYHSKKYNIWRLIESFLMKNWQGHIHFV